MDLIRHQQAALATVQALEQERLGLAQRQQAQVLAEAGLEAHLQQQTPTQDLEVQRQQQLQQQHRERK